MVIENSIPLFIIEEHHEAYFIWNYGYFNRFIYPVGNTLLHIDSHDDMVIARLDKSIDELEDDLDKIYDFVYEQLGIASFIIPALYRGIINNYTHLCRYDAVSGKKTNHYVASYQSAGTFFRTGKIDPFFRLQLESTDDTWGKYQFYTHQEIGLASKFSTGQSLILDIDLDYFSCDNSLSSVEKKIEITPKAFEDFRNNKYHPFRILPAAGVSVSCDSDGYYMHYREWQEIPNLKKATSELIDKRITRLIDFLSNNNLKPRLIDICRSRYSGYTPVDQWEYIENRLLDALGQIYYLDIKHINEISMIGGQKCESNSQGNIGKGKYFNKIR